MRSLILAATFLASMAFPAQAQSTCDNPENLHKQLVQSGYFLSIFSTSDTGHLFSYYTGKHGYVLTIEDQDIACVLAFGAVVYAMGGIRI